MLQPEAGGDDHHADPVGHFECGQQAEDHEQDEHDNMHEKGGVQRIGRAPAHDDGVQFVRAVELKILNGVNDVEPDQPQHHDQRQQSWDERAVPKRPGEIQRAIDRQPGPHRRNG